LKTTTSLRTTRIGVAHSKDGIHFQRMNGGHAIIGPSGPLGDHHYGAGQPTVTYVDGYFTLLYTDTTGQDIDGNGGGQFVVRSHDPVFTTGVQVLSATGFVARTAANATAHSLIHAFSTDWQFVDALDQWAVAVDAGAGKTRIHLFDRALTHE